MVIYIIYLYIYIYISIYYIHIYILKKGGHKKIIDILTTSFD